MPRQGAFEAEGLVVEVLPNGVFRTELANGHRLLAYLVKRDKEASCEIGPGRKIRLELSPCDLSRGRIMVERRVS